VGPLSTVSGLESTLPLWELVLCPVQGIQWLFWLLHDELFSFLLLSYLGVQFNVSFGI
jgi:hypothetical protein